MPNVGEMRLVRVKGYKNLVFQQFLPDEGGKRDWRNIPVINLDETEIEVPSGIAQRKPKKPAN